MIGKVRSGAWKSAVTSAPRSVVPPGTGAGAASVVGGSMGGTEPTSVESGNVGAGRVGPPGVALNVAEHGVARPGQHPSSLPPHGLWGLPGCLGEDRGDDTKSCNCTRSKRLETAHTTLHFFGIIGRFRACDELSQV